MSSQLRVNRHAAPSQLSAATMHRVRAATGFENITVVGGRSIRNPLTGRICRLQTERDVVRLEQCAEVMVGRARFLHEGVGGYSFRRVRVHEAAGLSMWEYRLPYNVPVDRLTLDMKCLLEQFCEKAGVPSTSLIRVAGFLSESQAWVSEKMKTIDQLVNMNEPLFMGSSSGTQYAHLEDISCLRLTVATRSGSGSGSKCKDMSEVPLYAQKRQCIAYIFNDDNLCGQRALVFCMEKDKDIRKNLLRAEPKRAAAFKAKAVALGETIQATGEMGPMEFKQFVATYLEWGVVVFDSFENVMLAMESDRPNVAYLFYHTTPDGNGHYHAVRSPDSFHKDGRFCRLCLKFYDRKTIAHHDCPEFPYRCNHCNVRYKTPQELALHKIQTTEDEKRALVCLKCNHWAHSEECQAMHKCDGKTRRCDLCKKNYQVNAEEPHVCFAQKCKCCSKMVDLKQHRCFIQQITKQPSDKLTFIAFDFECDIVTYGHHVVVAVAWCEVGKPESMQYLSGWDTLEKFVAIILKFKNTCFVAHNGRGTQ